MSTDTAEQFGSRQFCSECGRPFDGADLVRFGSAVVCAECKPAYVQRMREGVANPNAFVYAGFWRRFVAVFIDGILLWIVFIPVRLLLGMGLMGNRYDTLNYAYVGAAAYFAISLAVGIGYYVYFLSQKAATPGKMIMGVKVITATGGSISVGRALGRYFAQYISAITLAIGYIMAAFDDQKRALHDHICNTRVIRD